MPIPIRAALPCLLAAVLLAGCGGGQDASSVTEEPATGQAVEATDPPPSRASSEEAEAKHTVIGYLQALAVGEGAACDFLTTGFQRRIAGSQDYGPHSRELWRIRCETHARDLTEDAALALTPRNPEVTEASSTRADVDIEVILLESAPSSYRAIREAWIGAVYHLIRSGGRWHIDNIAEQHFEENDGDAVSSPISADFGGNLVLVRGCDAPELEYC